MLKLSVFMRSSVSDYQCVQRLLSNTSRFVSFPFRNLESKENRSTEAQLLGQVLLAWGTGCIPMTFLSHKRHWGAQAAAHSFSNSESAEKLPLGKKWVLSVAGTHFRYLTNGKKKKVKPTLFLHKRPSFCCDAFLDSACKSGKGKKMGYLFSYRLCSLYSWQ